jgi:hypothetical protein
MRLLVALVAVAALAAGCSAGPSAGPSSGAAGTARRAADPRVRSFMGQALPDVTGDVRWLNVPPTTLGALRGRVVFLQFAFPT